MISSEVRHNSLFVFMYLIHGIWFYVLLYCLHFVINVPCSVKRVIFKFDDLTFLPAGEKCQNLTNNNKSKFQGISLNKVQFNNGSEVREHIALVPAMLRNRSIVPRYGFRERMVFTGR